MIRSIWLTLALASSLASAQQQGGQAPANAGQNQPVQPPASASPASQQPSGANPFPEDTTTVPVMPTKDAPVQPDYGAADQGARAPLPSEDSDPARSPEDPAPSSGDGQASGFSSSLQGLDNVVPPPDPDTSGKKTKKEPTHQEAASEDVEVGKYYLSNKNWKAALSRFQSAMVLDPENPEVYWGLAEADRHLDDFAEARANYQKLLDYDPDGPHGKEARKAMKDPQIANAQNSSPSHP